MIFLPWSLAANENEKKLNGPRRESDGGQIVNATVKSAGHARQLSGGKVHFVLQGVNVHSFSLSPLAAEERDKVENAVK